MSSSKKYKISIITPILNSELYLERCVRSLLKQKFEYIQYIFINDASKDDSLSLLNKIICQYPSKKDDCVIINQKNNNGISYCRQLGINTSSGEYILFCDSDDYVEPEMFEILYNRAKQKNADLVSYGYYIESSYFTKAVLKKYGDTAAILKDIYGKSEIALWDKLFKRDLLIENNIFPSKGYNYYEDCYITVKAIYFAKKIETVDIHLYHYVDHPYSSSKKNILENLMSMKYYIEELENFFKKQKANPKIYSTLIKRLKFQYKLKLKENSLISKKEWNGLYKDCHSDILKFIDIPFIGRLKLYSLVNLRVF